LFVAVEPSDEARRWLEKVSKGLRAECEARKIRARFVPADNLHVTLRFIGDVEEEKAEAIGEALRGSDLPSTDRFEIRFSGLGAFPNEKKSRVLWVGLMGGARGLKTLAEQVDRCLQGVGIAPEERPFRPHLTLARIKKGRENTSRLIESVSPREDVSSLVHEVVLFQSDLGPPQAVHTPRVRVPLG
jgi:2'-5' RNA ligase